MKVTLVAVGRVRGPLAAAVLDYEERVRRYWKLEVVEVGAGGRGGRGGSAEVRAQEEERILGRIPEGAQVVALTREGKGMASAELAGWLAELALHASPGPAFVLGGAFGLGEGVLARAGKRLSLSPFTLPHELARLVLVEQLYRAGTLLRGEPYHKGS